MKLTSVIIGALLQVVAFVSVSVDRSEANEAYHSHHRSSAGTSSSVRVRVKVSIRQMQPSTSGL
jgi:hypothetical protein